jgi:hypothetical protein
MVVVVRNRTSPAMAICDYTDFFFLSLFLRHSRFSYRFELNFDLDILDVQVNSWHRTSCLRNRLALIGNEFLRVSRSGLLNPISLIYRALLPITPTN